MTTCGPYRRLTIRTLDAIITITGSNMMATVTSCDGGAPPQGYSFTDDVSSQGNAADASKTAEQDDLVSSFVGESSCSVDHRPFPSSDTESVSHSATQVKEETPLQCPPNTTVSHKTSTSNPTIELKPTHSTCSSVHFDGDFESGTCNDIGSATCSNECGSYSESEQGCTQTPSSPISSGSNIIDSDSESQLSEASSELQSIIGNKRKCRDRELEENSDSNGKEQSVVIRKSICSSVGQVGGDIGSSDSDSNSSDSELQFEGEMSLKKKKRSRFSHDSSSKVFSTTGRVGSNLSTHTRVVSHSCDTCGKTFTTLHCLARHARIHTGERPYSCDTCGKTFTTSGVLTKHTRIHTGERPYSCDTCGKTFTASGSLTRHTRIHIGERPYSCDTCGKTFTASGSLTKHTRIHTGERPYSCDTCGKTFTTSGSLTKHTRIHTGERPYSCDTCGKTFTQPGSLTKHTRIHTVERPYSCDTCGKTFTQPGNLTKHTRIHTGERPYSCDTCGETFTSSGGLSRHTSIHM